MQDNLDSAVLRFTYIGTCLHKKLGITETLYGNFRSGNAVGNQLFLYGLRAAYGKVLVIGGATRCISVTIHFDRRGLVCAAV